MKTVFLRIGDISDDGKVTIIDEDRLCYIVKNESKGASGLRTISKIYYLNLLTMLRQIRKQRLMKQERHFAEKRIMINSNMDMHQLWLQWLKWQSIRKSSFRKKAEILYH